MTKEYIIGREGDQKFKIDDEKYSAVSRRHARLTIDDSTNEWRLRDEGSANGTYIVDGQGNLQPVNDEVTISPTTRISLGGKRYNALTIVAHTVVDGGTTFAPDFDELERRLADLKRRIDKKRNTMKWTRIAFALLPIACMAIPGLGMEARFVCISAASLLNAVLAGFNDPTSFNEERSRTIVCPKCGRALTDKDVERHCCPCGAH